MNIHIMQCTQFVLFFEYLMLEKQEIIWGGDFKTVDLNAKFKQIQISPPPNLVLFFYLF